MPRTTGDFAVQFQDITRVTEARSSPIQKADPMAQPQFERAVKKIFAHAGIGGAASAVTSLLSCIPGVSQFKQQIHEITAAAHTAADIWLLIEIGEIYGIDADGTNENLINTGIMTVTAGGTMVSDVAIHLALEELDLPPAVKSVIHAGGRTGATVAAAFVYALICENYYG